MKFPTHLIGFLVLAFILTEATAQTSGQFANKDQLRAIDGAKEMEFWIQNMLQHRYSREEMMTVTGLSPEGLAAKLNEFGLQGGFSFPREDKLLVLPYPGGRHPRIGFLDGAIGPQRETKLSVFCPWDTDSYAVMDVPEAIWSNLGLTYLAHTHIDTVWTKQGVELEKLEWNRDGGTFSLVRRLPNGIEFGVKAIPLKDHVRMKMWLTNGTNKTLNDLRVQNCVMLKAAKGFEQQNNDNKQFKNGYAVCHSPDRQRWIISAWDPGHRSWGNTQCPCLHSDPKFPDCAPGETQWLRGWFSFYQGKNIDDELARIEATGWKSHPLHHVTGNLVGQVVDSATGKKLPCRLYVQNLETGEFHFATSTAVAGESVKYDKQMGKSASVERHTSLSAHGFQLNLPAGQYRISAERGKEYRPVSKVVEVKESRVNVKLELQRFVNMTELGWYSGDTHVHRSLQELPTVIQGEDLNVALPLTYWVRDSRANPAASNHEKMLAEPNYIDAQHVIYPINTEYEIFSIEGKRQTQGAVFVLNHKKPFQLTAPPVGKIAVQAREQEAILDLDKHSWNWSLMVIPTMDVDLFELSNNHHWRTQFGFTKWTLENAPPDWPEVERNANGFTERGWTEFGLQTYYRLLNCGFRMRVSAGTASGVHPVPLGYGRVYVHIDGKFSYDKWIENLNKGHSFVTQGPLMDIRFNGHLPGATWESTRTKNQVQILGTIRSAEQIETVELVSNGSVVKTIEMQPELTESGAYRYQVDETVELQGTSWLALRCFQARTAESPTGKVVFAHTNPVFVDVAAAPLIPRRTDVEYFHARMEEEIKRNEGVISPAALAEYHEAKAVYEKLLKSAEH